MTDADFHSARETYLRSGEPPKALLDECRAVLRRLIDRGGLTHHYSPYGKWDEEAKDELFADWLAVRAVRRNQLRALAERAPVLWTFRASIETSMKQHARDRRARSQSSNLFDRLKRLLRESDDYISTGPEPGRLWSTPTGPSRAFPDDEMRLLSVAWSLGTFELIRYEPGAKKLSPVLSADELDRFVRGMLEAGAMTTAMLILALQKRFSLDQDAPPLELGEDVQGHDDRPDAQLEDRQTALAVLSELTSRQARILKGLHDDIPFRQLADELDCALGTISHEKDRIGETLARHGAQTGPALNIVLDALFERTI